MMMPGRSYTAGNSYRYGFNGKENDNEVKGVEGSQQDYGMRIYDPRLGRFLSVDPLTKKYPELTPYQFASNTPIQGIDLDGLEIYYSADGTLLGKMGTNTSVYLVNDDYVQKLPQTIKTIEKDPWNSLEKLFANIELSMNTKPVGISNEELNARAFLTTVRQAENANENKEPLAYNVIYGGGTFDDYSKHPQKSVTKWGRTSDAAGAYQFKATSWKMVASLLSLKDFKPESQDAGAIKLIHLQDKDNPRAAGVSNDIMTGNVESAASKLNGTWTSLPGGNEQQMTSDEFKKQFKENISKELKYQSSIATPRGFLKI
jgi:RHS repeat-associated protein